MIGYRQPDGLSGIARILVSLQYDVRVDALRRWVQWFQLTFFGLCFSAVVTAETLFATLIFAVIQVEILGTIFSGAAFALLVPTAIGYAHVKLHHEADHFTRWWLSRLGAVGLLFFALGISLMVGFSAWQAAKDSIGVIQDGATGTLGDRPIGSDTESSGLAAWVSIIPNTMLFVGLSFGMIIAINFASFCLGRVLQAFNVLTLTPPVGKEAKALIAGLNAKIAVLRRQRDEYAMARRKLPFDVAAKFAREAASACWRVAQTKRAAARRKFDPMRSNDPLATAFADRDVDSIPNEFTSEEAFLRHLADQIDAVRMHNLLRVLSGFPEGER